MSVNRYYAEHTLVDPLFASDHKTGWQVFDRDNTSAQGGSMAVCFCVTRKAAFLVRDSLNIEDSLHA